MNTEIKEYEKNKFQLIGTFEIGDSGVFEQRILVSGLSKNKAIKLKSNCDDGSIYKR